MCKLRRLVDMYKTGYYRGIGRDRVEYFKDPEFWEDYNIIEPTESLDKAIDKLVRLAEKK